jgi:hypothetical protein
MSSTILRGVVNLNFLHIPKTGGSSVHAWLIKHHGPKTQSWSFNKHPKLSVFTEGYGPAFTFTVVRNPWDRFVSMYHWAQTVKRDNGRNLFNITNKKFLENNNFDADNMPSFEWVVDNMDSIVNAEGATGLIARNQSTHWMDAPVDYIVKFETINEDMKVVMDMVGVSGTIIPHTNKTVRKDYREYYTDRTRDVIAKVFEADIERFKYQF